jgi:hypothetical protein
VRQITRDRFTTDEDAKITAFVAQGLRWGEIVELMGGQRTRRQVRERWHDYLNPSLAAEYTRDDDGRIEELYRQLGPRWAKIAEALGNRSGISVRNRHRHLMNLRAKGERPYYSTPLPWYMGIPDAEAYEEDIQDLL